MPIRLVVLTLLLTTISYATAWADIDCKDAQTQTDMNICADYAFKKSDEDLNATYKKALKMLQTSDASKLKKFKETQRAWIKFRDLNCDYAAKVYEGGTMARMAHASCMQELTEQRTKQIPHLFPEWE